MRRRSAGFTLAELLVALAITSLLVLLLGNVVSAALRVWQQGRNRLDTFANARFILNQIGDEIVGASAQQGRIQFVENYSFSSGPTAIATSSENVFFVAPYPNDKAGDLCVVAYGLDANTHQLQRAFKDSDQAWTAGPSSRYRAAGYDGTLEWRVIANGVLEFEIQSYSQQDMAVSPPPAPAAAWDSESGASAMAGQTPRRIVIRLKVVDDKTAVTLATLTPGPAYNRLVQEKAREFSLDVSLPPR
jgi:prepilin-type N-terminal cleavage/methylation domain-containing protein